MNLFQDIRFSFRVMKKTPGITAVAVLSLALGIGANCAMFSMVDALVFSPLQVPDPHRVLNIYSGNHDYGLSSLSYPEFEDLRREAKSYEGLVGSSMMTLNLGEAGSSTERPPQIVQGAAVSAGYFEAMHVPITLGRGFSTEEERALNGSAAAVISRDLWKRRYQSDPNVRGREIRINGTHYTIVGVTPESFHGLDRWVWCDLYIPLTMQKTLASAGSAKDLYTSRKDRWIRAYGRLRGGVSESQANAELRTIASQWEQAYPDSNRGRLLRGISESKSRIEDSPETQSICLALLTLVGLILLIGCANVANILLSRASSRKREIAVRIAVGASRGRLIAQLLTESAMLSAAGGALGLGFAYWLTSLLRGIQMPTDLPVRFNAQLDERALLYAGIAALLTTFLFGLVPSLQVSRPDLIPALKNVTQSVGHSRWRIPFRGALVTGQLAVCTVLLIMSALMLKGMIALEGKDPGFHRENRLLLTLDPRLQNYTPDAGKQLYQRVLERARQQPGVLSATVIDPVLTGPEGDYVSFIVEGYQMPKDRESEGANCASVEPGYFEAMESPIVKGRALRESDDANHPLVLVVNETLAAKYWPKQDPIGKRVRIKQEWAEVVGVAKNGIYFEAMDEERAFVFRSFRQNYTGRATVVLRTQGEPTSMATPMRTLIRELDPTLAVFDVRSLSSLYQGKALLGAHLLLYTMEGMGVLGLALALIGLYGVVAYSVSMRFKEIGIRMSLGASRASVLSMVLRQALLYFAIGAPIGLALAVAFITPLRFILGGINPYAFDVFLGIPVLFALVTLAAAMQPATTAARINPITALRSE